MTVKTHWKQLADNRFIGAHLLPGGHDLTVQIERVQRELLTMDDGKEGNYIVLYLAGQLPMILNATNAKTIQRLYGAYIEDWPGKSITLFCSTATLNNEQVECLRVRPAPPRTEKEQISNTRFKRAVMQIKAKQFTAEQLREQFTLTKEQETTLRAIK